MTGMVLSVAGGFAAIPGSTSGGLIVPFDRESALLVVSGGPSFSGGTRVALFPVGGGTVGTGGLVWA